MGSGIFWTKSGTNPSVAWMSARALAAAGVSAKALVEMPRRAMRVKNSLVRKRLRFMVVAFEVEGGSLENGGFVQGSGRVGRTWGFDEDGVDFTTVRWCTRVMELAR